MDCVMSSFKVCLLDIRRLFLVVGVTACTILLIHSFTLPYRVVLQSLAPAFATSEFSPKMIVNANRSSKFSRVDQVQLVSGVKYIYLPTIMGLNNESMTFDEGNIENEYSEDDITIEAEEYPEVGHDEDADNDNSSGMIGNKYAEFGNGLGKTNVSEDGVLHVNSTEISNLFIATESNDSMQFRISISVNTSTASSTHAKKESDTRSDTKVQINIPNLGRRHPRLEKKRTSSRISIAEMNSILRNNQVSPNSLKKQRLLARDRELLAAKSQIENAPMSKDDPRLYAPLFRNVSRFKRSYELMEQTLKVYLYKEGDKPIFHQPLLRGIYASEGWFMKLMERNKRFVVKDPRKAHLFYLPFSSRMLQLTLYVPHQSNRKILMAFLNKYVEKIATKYPFWNRTNGADHFLAACHDWASFETRTKLASSIRALCNADLSGGFKIGKDVSLPETYIRSAQNPQRDLGGNPGNQRPILAFYAGGVHGWLRQSLLDIWENKDPAIKIYGSKFPGIEGKMTYIQHMKTSKYCICPRGYEVNSPRIVEAIFYECVPVIISDNFVPPFFEVLEWEAFAIFIAEKDIPNLKKILLSVPEEKYLYMQNGVKKVQRHFLWHSSPIKYDMFHMILHSIWFSRLNRIGIK